MQDPSPKPSDCPSAPGRRRWLAALAALGIAGALRAQSQGFTLSGQAIDALLAHAFPYTRNLSGLAELRLEAPRVGFLPASNRLSTAVRFVFSEALAGRSAGGALDLDYALRFDARQGAIRLADVRVSQVEVDRLPPGRQRLVSLYASQAAEFFLNGLVLYHLPESQLALLRNLGLTVRSLRVLPDGVRAEFGPRGLD